MHVQATDNFRKHLREAMERAGISQRELAERAATAHPGINRILQGKQVPTLDLADRIADAVGVPLHELLGKNIGKNSRKAG